MCVCVRVHIHMHVHISTNKKQDWPGVPTESRLSPARRLIHYTATWAPCAVSSACLVTDWPSRGVYRTNSKRIAPIRRFPERSSAAFRNTVTGANASWTRAISVHEADMSITRRVSLCRVACMRLLGFDFYSDIPPMEGLPRLLRPAPCSWAHVQLSRLRQQHPVTE